MCGLQFWEWHQDIVRVRLSVTEAVVFLVFCSTSGDAARKVQHSVQSFSQFNDHAFFVSLSMVGSANAPWKLYLYLGYVHILLRWSECLVWEKGMVSYSESQTVEYIRQWMCSTQDKLCFRGASAVHEHAVLRVLGSLRGVIIEHIYSGKTTVIQFALSKSLRLFNSSGPITDTKCWRLSALPHTAPIHT